MELLRWIPMASQIVLILAPHKELLSWILPVVIISLLQRPLQVDQTTTLATLLLLLLWTTKWVR